MTLSKVFLSVVGVVFCAAAAPAWADEIQTAAGQTHLTITPIFNSSITGDPNAAQIEGTINSLVAMYAADFSNPITVSITFQEGGGLGGSTWVPSSEGWTTFYGQLKADATSVDDTTALARLALDGTANGMVNGTVKSTNPVNGGANVNIKPANLCVLQNDNIAGHLCTSVVGGTITINTALTSPGGATLPNAYNLAPVVEHEIDEILGLGSTLGVSGLTQSNPSPEDFFRFTAPDTNHPNGARSFVSTATTGVYFSLNGTTNLDLFDNANDGGDYGDWEGNASPQVQDAFGIQNVNPSLNVELRALDVIGYTRITPTAPEPGTFLLVGGGLIVAGLGRRRARR